MLHWFVYFHGVGSVECVIIMNFWSRSVLLATSQRGHSWYRVPCGPMIIPLRPLSFSPLFIEPPLRCEEGLVFLSRCPLTCISPSSAGGYSTSTATKKGIYIHYMHYIQIYIIFWYIQIPLSMQDSVAGCDLNYSTLRKLDTWTIVSLTAEKFKPLVFPMNGWKFQSQSQSYFTTGGLPPISSSWPQAPWGSRPEIFFPNGTLAVIVWREDGVVSYEYACPIVKCTYCFCNIRIYNSSVSPGFAKQIILILCSLCYNSSSKSKSKSRCNRRSVSQSVLKTSRQILMMSTETDCPWNVGHS
jgi:hypothetical protein